MLIIWDRLFGTFSPETADEPVQYGLTKNIETYHPVKVAFGEYARIWADIARTNSWSDAVRYLLWAPGWNHDGDDLRSDTLRRRQRARQIN